MYTFHFRIQSFLAQTPPGASVVHKSLQPHAMSSLLTCRPEPWTRFLKPWVLGLLPPSSPQLLKVDSDPGSLGLDFSPISVRSRASIYSQRQPHGK